MTIPKRFDEVLEEQLLEQRQAGLLGDLGAVGATALAVGELGLNPVADAAAVGADAAAIGGGIADAADAAAGGMKAVRGLGTAFNSVNQNNSQTQQQQQQTPQQIPQQDQTPQFSMNPFQVSASLVGDVVKDTTNLMTTGNPTGKADPISNFVDKIDDSGKGAPDAVAASGTTASFKVISFYDGTPVSTMPLSFDQDSVAAPATPLTVPMPEFPVKPSKNPPHTPEISLKHKNVKRTLTYEKAQTETEPKREETDTEKGAVDSVSKQPRMPQGTGHQFNFEISVPEHIVEFRHPGNPARSASASDDLRVIRLIEDDMIHTASLRCDGCGYVNDPGVKSCAACNKPKMSRRCPGCGSINEITNKNCEACNRYLDGKITTWE